MAIPQGYYGQLHPRSSLAKKGLSVEGGVIDLDYRGPIKIILRNQGDKPYSFKCGDLPITQIILVKITTPTIQEVDSLLETTRTGGFGSTNPTPVTYISMPQLIQTTT